MRVWDGYMTLNADGSPWMFFVTRSEAEEQVRDWEGSFPEDRLSIVPIRLRERADI